jgi:hypothetical protein
MAKWPKRPFDEDVIPYADAITGSLRTKMNTLSLWEIESAAELDDAILAIVAQGDNTDSIDIILIEPENIKTGGLSFEKTEGTTPYTAFLERHIDVIDLNYKTLGIFAMVVLNGIASEKVHRVTSSQLKNILDHGLKNGKINLESLSRKLQQHLMDW